MAATGIQRLPPILFDDALWREAELQERLKALQALEDYLSEIQVRTACKVESYLAPIEEGGYLNEIEQKICVNELFICAETFEASVVVAAHEGRHAYQFDCLQRPDEHKEISPQTINIWHENFEPVNYKRPEKSARAYENQPVEIDARAYAESVVQALRTRTLEKLEPVRDVTQTKQDSSEDIEKDLAAIHARKPNLPPKQPETEAETLEESESQGRSR